MVKAMRTVEVTICDFCKEEATAECPICGKDVCRAHDFTLIRSYRAPGEGFDSSWPQVIEVVRHFCPDDLSDELRAHIGVPRTMED